MNREGRGKMQIRETQEQPPGTNGTKNVKRIEKLEKDKGVAGEKREKGKKAFEAWNRRTSGWSARGTQRKQRRGWRNQK